MCNLEQSEVIPPLSPKGKEGGKTWLCCSRNCYWSNRWIPFVIVVICTFYLQSLQINKNTLILFGDHLDWGTYGRLLASLLSAVANVGTAGKGAGGPKSLY